MLIVQYLMQFDGPPRSINTHIHQRFEQLTQLGLHFMHYYHPLNIDRELSPDL